MSVSLLERAHKALAWSTAGLMTLCLTLVTVSLWSTTGEEAQARLVKEQKETPWKVFTESEVQTGVVIPANTHVVFHLPSTFTTITRETLLGHKGKSVRYWGYCFPQNYDPKTVDKRRGFPGLLFLSEKERAVRKAEESRSVRAFSTLDLPTAEEVARMNQRTTPAIRHQLEIFEPGTMCYIQSAESLSIGIDQDNDLLNSKLEHELNTNPKITDTDGDGIIDGVEYLHGTSPTLRDSDGDNVIDGIEDSDWDGKIDADETDPRTWDSDRDGLCDGFCRFHFQRQWVFIGEDKNINGTVDKGETDPRVWDSDDDGYGDEVEFLRCLADGNDSAQCPNG